jgi:hypothetical protein
MTFSGEMKHIKFHLTPILTPTLMPGLVLFLFIKHCGFCWDITEKQHLESAQKMCDGTF